MECRLVNNNKTLFTTQRPGNRRQGNDLFAVGESYAESLNIFIRIVRIFENVFLGFGTGFADFLGPFADILNKFAGHLKVIAHIISILCIFGRRGNKHGDRGRRPGITGTAGLFNDGNW